MSGIQKRDIVVVYVAGYGRSGSTVLDMLLGLNEHVVGMSELTHAVHFWNGNQPCSCGLNFQACPFWTQIFGRVDCPTIPLSRSTRLIEGTPPLFSRLFLGSHRKRYSAGWSQIILTIAELTGKPIVVDSSKSSRLAAFRPQMLAKLCDLNVKIIHLVRDPRAVTFSYLRGNNVKLEEGVRIVKKGGAYRALLSWMFSNSIVHVTNALTAESDFVRVRYEDLVTDPQSEFRRIAKQLNLNDLKEDFLTIENPQPADDHGVAGNRVRRLGIHELRLDDQWKTSLDRRYHRLAMISWPLMKKYGYA